MYRPSDHNLFTRYFDASLIFDHFGALHSFGFDPLKSLVAAAPLLYTAFRTVRRVRIHQLGNYLTGRLGVRLFL